MHSGCGAGRPTPILAALALAGATVLALQSPACATPPGRWWTPSANLTLTGFDALNGDILEFAPDGHLHLTGTAVRQLPDFTYDDRLFDFAWKDTTWVLQWLGDHQPLGLLRPLVPAGPSGAASWILWSENVQVPPRPTYPLLAASWSAESLGVADTVAKLKGGSYNYAGAVGGNGRRWVAAIGIGTPQGLYLRVSDTFGQWRGGLIIPGRAVTNVAIGALDDSSALIVWGQEFGVPFHWGVARDTTFVEYPAPVFQSAWHPVLRPDEGGTWWVGLGLGWLSPQTALMRYRQGEWSPPESLSCRELTPGAGHETYYPTMSFDGYAMPTAAWQVYYYPSQSSACVCFPTDSSYGECEELQTGGVTGGPIVARDLNGDVWAAWWRFYAGTFWTHTYTRATCTAPSFEGSLDQPVVRWGLSEPAPESWWAVLRAEPGGEFESVARVRAGADVEMAWTDTSAPVGQMLRYQIRRECLDKRYEWLSEEALWWPRIAGVHLSMAGPHPVTGPFEVEVLGAPAGRVTLTLYDVQGRAVARQAAWVSGSGRDVLRVEAVAREEVHAGVYFVRARHANGRESNAVRLVVLR